ncbi:MAG: twin-arginine translocation signal domain-containing protein [Bryobacteraceae bacterium]
MFSRRNFLTASSALCGSAGLIRPASILAALSKPSGYFGVHPFVEQHPEAVFILRTHVDRKTNSAACKRVGLDFGRSVFVPMDATGTPVSHYIATKPNLTAHDAVDPKRGFTLEDTMGIATDVFFVEGLFESLKELGVAGTKIHTRDINGVDVIGPRGYVAMGQRVGATVAPIKDTIATRDDAKHDEAFVWKEVPGGVVHTQVPYLWPFNARDSWNLNVAKFKAHEMGLTLTAKNWQGSHATPFQRYCGQWPDIDSMQKLEKTIAKECIHPKVREVIEANFRRHKASIPRWDTPDVPKSDPNYNEAYYYTAMCMELWAHRTIDNHAASPMGLHIVEGIYGRDGDFNYGPNPLGNENNYEGRAWDYMTNIVIFGKNPYLVDLIGHWLGGHEPGNFGLFHIAMERGKLGVINPMNVPVYEWVDGVAVRRPLQGFTRTPLRSFYLQQRTKEPLWHLCNQPFDYSTVSENRPAVPARPTTRVLNQHYPNANNPQMAIEYSVPHTGWVLLEILDPKGNNLEVISNAVCEAGYHMAAWNTAKYASGSYQYRLRYDGYSEVHGLVLNKA